jgi:hypothetical protein
VLLVAHFRDCLEQVQAIVQQGGFDNMIATTAENLTGRSKEESNPGSLVGSTAETLD